jgi:hypothetical protein
LEEFDHFRHRDGKSGQCRHESFETGGTHPNGCRFHQHIFGRPYRCVAHEAEMTSFLIVATVALRAIKQQGRYRVY